MMMTMTMMKGLCAGVVVVLVVIGCGRVSSADDDDRPVINPIFRVAVIESCFLQARKFLEKYRDEIVKVEIHHVGDMTYKADGTITASIGYKRHAADPIDQFVSCKYSLSYNRGKFTVPDENPFEIINVGCVA